MTGGVNNVESHALFGSGRTHVAHRCVLGKDRDSLFALKIHRVHDPVIHVLVFPESPGLPQHGVYERGFAMVNVGNDGNIA